LIDHGNMGVFIDHLHSVVTKSNCFLNTWTEHFVLGIDVLYKCFAVLLSSLPVATHGYRPSCPVIHRTGWL
jgi:hypothetical protein